MAEHPIACTLQAEAFHDRVVWIQNLFDHHLRERRQDDLALHLTFAPEAVDEVAELVRRESACCAFLSFDQVTTDDTVRLTITAPEEAREGAAMIFAPFNASSGNLGLGAPQTSRTERPGGVFGTLMLSVLALTGGCNCANPESAVNSGP